MPAACSVSFDGLPDMHEGQRDQLLLVVVEEGERQAREVALRRQALEREGEGGAVRDGRPEQAAQRVVALRRVAAAEVEIEPVVVLEEDRAHRHGEPVEFRLVLADRDGADILLVQRHRDVAVFGQQRGRGGAAQAELGRGHHLVGADAELHALQLARAAQGERAERAELPQREHDAAGLAAGSGRRCGLRGDRLCQGRPGRRGIRRGREARRTVRTGRGSRCLAGIKPWP